MAAIHGVGGELIPKTTTIPPSGSTGNWRGGNTLTAGTDEAVERAWHREAGGRPEYGLWKDFLQTFQFSAIVEPAADRWHPRARRAMLAVPRFLQGICLYEFFFAPGGLGTIVVGVDSPRPGTACVP